MVDASSALWRLFLDRVELGDRWQVLAESWQEKAFQSFYTFNDMHAMMAFVGSGDGRAGEQLIEGLKTYLSRRRDTETNYAITRDIGVNGGVKTRWGALEIPCHFCKLKKRNDTCEKNLILM